MKLSKLFLFAAFLTPLLGSCSKDSDLPDSGITGLSDEIQLVFNGSSDGEIYTRGIATESENEIKDLRIYVFASNNQTDYYYQELWSTDAGDVPAEKLLTLQGTGVSRKTSIFPGEWKTMPYLKLYCVANSKLYITDGATPAILTAITGTDSTPVTAGVTTSTDFEAFTTATVGVTNPIETPLAMRGVTTTKISGNYSKVDVEMKRVVARFDIDNDADKTALTIERLWVDNANPYATLFADPKGTGAAGAYPKVDYTLLKNANAGVSTGAVYVNPGVKANGSLLIIEGTYLNPNTKTQVPVTYKLPIAKNPSTAVAAGTPIDYIDILFNHRYTLRISQVTEAEITAMFEIEDWTSGGGVDVKPDNDVKPEVTSVTSDDAGITWADPFTHVSVTADGTITVVTKSTGKVEASITPIGEAITRTTVGNWLEAGVVTYDIADGLTQTTLLFKATGVTGASDMLLPTNITLTNQAASTDPDLQTVLTVIPPASDPTAEQSASYPSSSYNSMDFTAVPNPTATLYKGTDSKLYFDVTCPFGVDITQSVADLFSIRKVATFGLVETYALSLKDAATLEASATVTIANKDDGNKKLEWVITLSDAAIDKTAITATDATYDNTTNTLTIAAATTDPVTITIPSVAGVTLAQLDYSWFTVVHTTNWASGSPDTKKDVYTITQKSGKTPVDIPLTFVNAVKGAGDVTVTVKKGN